MIVLAVAILAALVVVAIPAAWRYLPPSLAAIVTGVLPGLMLAVLSTVVFFVVQTRRDRQRRARWSGPAYEVPVIQGGD